MKTLLFLFVLTVLILVPVIQESYACSCSSPVDYVAATMESEYVFIGTVTHIDNSNGPQKIHFDVDSVVKGDISNSKFVLENTGKTRQGDTRSESSCDVGYQMGVTYNVFVYDNESLNNSMCSTKAIGFLGMMNPLQYNIFHHVILALAVIAITMMSILIVKRKQRK